MDLTAHLSELNVCLQDENQLTCAMFQIIMAFEIKHKLWYFKKGRGNETIEHNLINN